MSLPQYTQVVNSIAKPVPVNVVAGGGGPVGTVDVTDRTARVLGHVIIDSFGGTVTVSGSVSVSNFPGTQPVSGTFWQATQPISIASMPSTPVTGTFWQATQPVSATSLPLPTGAAVESGGNLAAIKTDVDKIPNDPAREGGNLTTIVAGVNRITTPLFGTSVGLPYGVPMLASCSATEPAFLDGQMTPLSMTPDGRMRINLDDNPSSDCGEASPEDDIWDMDQSFEGDVVEINF
jgi:hypothetical protein